MISSNFYFILLASNMNSYLVHLLSDDDLFEAHFIFSMGVSPLFWIIITFAVVLNLNLSYFAGAGRVSKIIEIAIIGIIWFLVFSFLIIIIIFISGGKWFYFLVDGSNKVNNNILELSLIYAIGIFG